MSTFRLACSVTLFFFGSAGIMLLNPQYEIVVDIQNLVRVADDKTPWPKLPIGLNVDPRTSSIVMNGRIGQLQFYSPYNGSVFNVSTKITTH